MSVFNIVGHVVLQIAGFAPRTQLINIEGNNWPAPPLSCNHVTYVYVSGEDRAVLLATQYGARLRHADVRVDNNRMSRLIYHADGAQATFGASIVCMVVLEKAEDGRKWIHLVYLPDAIPPKVQVKKEDKRDEDKDDGNNNNNSSQPSQEIPFASLKLE